MQLCGYALEEVIFAVTELQSTLVKLKGTRKGKEREREYIKAIV